MLYSWHLSKTYAIFLVPCVITLILYLPQIGKNPDTKPFEWFSHKYTEIKNISRYILKRISGLNKNINDF